MRSLVQIVNPQSCEPSACEACGGEFTCGATLAGCWCAEIELSDEARARLRERHERCLCRTCLEKLAQGESIGATKL